MASQQPILARPLPEPLKPLGEIAENFWWTWSPNQAAGGGGGTHGLFSRLDPALWESTGRNPVLLLNSISDGALNAAAGDQGFTAALNEVHAAFTRHMSDGQERWFDQQRKAGKAGDGFLAAYFCAEFGVAECFQIYSGGLGLLAGDHLKSAADMGVPLVGVGLLYRNGYFHQQLDEHGYQHETYPPLDPANQAVRRVPDPKSRDAQLKVRVDLGDRAVACAVWRADVGRTRLYLLDTNLDENAEPDRDITANLYLGDQHRRIQQEIVLGIGGVRALAALGERPTVFHMNEGHAAFMALERIRVLRESHPAPPNLTFDQAREAAAAAHVFTTHTPVPAGIDRFAPALVTQYFSNFVGSLGLDIEGLLALGREDVADRSEAFSMAVLALRTSRFANGVSRLHGRVSRTMWRPIWPDTPEDDVPIGHVTNGVHTQTWVDPALARLLDQHAGQAWRGTPQDEASWSGVASIPDEQLWAQRNDARRTLVEYVRRRATATARRLDHQADLDACESLLNPAALTIGFARRFAGYKRGTLLLHDTPRLVKLLTDPHRPIQLVVAGKAHPGDGRGKDLIRELVEFSRLPKVRGHIVFLEDYDIRVAQHLVRGCDLWLNNPIRGLEASGTSGMKAALNGCLNCSIRDGWWDEGYSPSVGYAIDALGTYLTDEPRGEREDYEAQSLYRTLEEKVVPDFYERDGTGENAPPKRWVAKMKQSIATLGPRFSTHRMLAEYASRYYFPAHAAAAELAKDNLAPARELADHIARYRAHWQSLRIRSVFGELADGQGLVVNAIVRLDGLDPGEVRVEVLAGPVREVRVQPSLATAMASTEYMLGGGNDAVYAAMQPRDHLGEGTHHYHALIGEDRLNKLPSGGRRGFQVRILPADPRLVTPYVPGLITTSVVYPLSGEDE